VVVVIMPAQDQMPNCPHSCTGTNRYLDLDLTLDHQTLVTQQYGVVRADFPMRPLKDQVYYFEVTVHAVGDQG
jgi:hypothetical protein